MLLKNLHVIAGWCHVPYSYEYHGTVSIRSNTVIETDTMVRYRYRYRYTMVPWYCTILYWLGTIYWYGFPFHPMLPPIGASCAFANVSSTSYHNVTHDALVLPSMN